MKILCIIVAAVCGFLSLTASLFANPGSFAELMALWAIATLLFALVVKR